MQIDTGDISIPSHAANASTNPKRLATGAFNTMLEQATELRPILDEKARTSERVALRTSMLEAANADPQMAENLAYGFTYNYLDSAILDLSDRPNIRYTATGELVTPQSERYFKTISEAMQRQCANLYQQEKSKGTPDSEILEKVFNFHDSMPKPFKDMLAM